MRVIFLAAVALACSTVKPPPAAAPGVVEVATGVDGMLLDVEFLDASSAVAVGGTGERDPSLVVRTVDGGATWAPVDVAAAGRLYGVAAPDPDVVVAVGFGVALRSADRGRTWTTVDLPAVDARDARPWLGGVAFRDARTGFAVGGGSAPVLLRSDDAGASWTVAGAHLPDEVRGRGLRAAHFVDARRGVIACDGGLVLTTRDGGERWEARAIAGPEVWVKGLGFAEEGAGFAAGSHGTVAATDDAGATWRRVEFPAMQKLNIAGALDARAAFVGSMEGHLWGTLDGGASWTLRGEWPGRAVIGAALRPGPERELWFSCDGGTLLRVSRAGAD